MLHASRTLSDERILREQFRGLTASTACASNSIVSRFLVAEDNALLCAPPRGPMLERSARRRSIRRRVARPARPVSLKKCLPRHRPALLGDARTRSKGWPGRASAAPIVELEPRPLLPIRDDFPRMAERARVWRRAMRGVNALSRLSRVTPRVLYDKLARPRGRISGPYVAAPGYFRPAQRLRSAATRRIAREDDDRHDRSSGDQAWKIHSRPTRNPAIRAETRRDSWQSQPLLARQAVVLCTADYDRAAHARHQRARAPPSNSVRRQASRAAAGFLVGLNRASRAVVARQTAGAQARERLLRAAHGDLRGLRR